MTVKTPYRLYPVQQEILSDMKAWWKSDFKHMLLQAPTGTGKTLLHLVLTLLKLKGHRTIYFSREHAQIEQCVFELRKLIDINPGHSVKAVHIAGRGVSCIQPQVKLIADHEDQLVECESYDSVICNYHKLLTMSNEAKTDKFHQLTLMTQHHGVYWNYDIDEQHNKRVEGHMVVPVPLTQLSEELFADGIASNSKILEIAEKYIICPRKLQNLAMQDANIIFAPYNYMVIPRFPQSEEQLKTDFFVIDESHNLDTNLTNMLSVETSDRSVERYANAIRAIQYGELRENSTSILRALNKVKKIDKAILGDELKHLMEEIEVDEVIKLSDVLQAHIGHSIKHKTFAGGGSTSTKKIPKAFISFRKLNEAILRLKFNHLSGIFEYEKEEERFKIQFVDTDVIFKYVTNKAYKILISSGSLYPRFMRSYLGLNRKNTISHDYPPPHKNTEGIARVVVKYKNVRLSTSYKNRGDKVFDAYARVIRDIYEMNPNGTLVYFTSYKMRNEIGNRLQMWNIPYYEADTIEAYREVIAQDKKAIFMSAFRGLGSEGWNLGDNQSRVIALCGIPYLPRVAIVETQKAYYEKKKKGLGQSWYNQKAALWLMQSFGRGIRHKDDWTKVYFLDDRVGYLKSYFIKWVARATIWKPIDWSDIVNAKPRTRKRRQRTVAK